MMKEVSSSNKTQFDIQILPKKFPLKMMEVKRWVTDKKPGYVVFSKH